MPIYQANVYRTIGPLVIGFFSYMQVMSACIKAWMSSKFGQMRPLVFMATVRVAMGKTASLRCSNVFSLPELKAHR